jgi:hypothetical protein
MAAPSSLVQVFRRAGRCPPRPPERGSLRHVVITGALRLRPRVGLRAGSIQRRAQKRTTNRFQRRPCRQPSFSVISPRCALQRWPRPALVAGAHRVTAAAKVPRWSATTMPGASGPVLSRCARSRAAPPAAQRRGCPARPRRAASLAARRAPRPLAATE